MDFHTSEQWTFDIFIVILGPRYVNVIRHCGMGKD